MRIQIYVLFYLEGHERIDIPGQKTESVVRTQRIKIRKFISCTAALKTKGLEDLEGRVNRKTVDIHDARLLMTWWE